MTHRYYLAGILLTALLGWVSWVLVISNLSPFISGYLALSLFYSSLFIALSGTFGILNYYLRQMMIKKGDRFHHINASLRQGSLLSIMLCLGLVFQRQKVLTWWVALLLFAIIVLTEYYFVSKH